ncbi:uncharacterized protein LOC129605950 [Condylostylus longicornis]|uniref:uncharacterized protein LOC129605950 n=1 Tax=Condylostylus longicornis TaxID=2530218 RepID=UPI00244E56B9|nr:uncharacterized protein LOC129605950 [Condylostylus longicornis]
MYMIPEENDFQEDNTENADLQDISYSKSLNQVEEDHEKDQEKQELMRLLTDWKQEFLVNDLINQKIFTGVLKVLRPHHIERILRNYDLGTQILFEHNLFEWRKLIGIPLVYDECNHLVPSNIPISPSSSLVSRSPTPSRENRFSPYFFHQSDDCEITLNNILNENAKGEMLVGYYNKYSKFEAEQRTILVNLIAQHFEEKGVAMTLAVSYKLENEILERFTNEKLEYYRTSKRGKIYNKCCNLKMSLKNILCQNTNEKTLKKVSSKNYREEKFFESEHDAEGCLRALKYDNLEADHFDNVWKACSQYRLNDIKNFQNTSEIMEKWPFYKFPTGFRLVI